MRITVYRLTGRQGLFTIPGWMCPPCDLTVAAVPHACHMAGIPEDAVTVRPWLVHLGKAWRSGARHAPAVLVNGDLYSQKIVPDARALAIHLRRIRATETALSAGWMHES